MVGNASDSLEKRLCGPLDEICSQWNWAPDSGFLNSPGCLLGTSCPSPARHSRQASQTWPIALAAAVVKKKRLCTPSITTASESANFGVTSENGRPALITKFSAAQHCLRQSQSYVEVDPTWKGGKRLMFFTILPVAEIVIWETEKKGFYDGANFSLHHLIL